MNNWLIGSSEYVDLMCYCSHRFKETWNQKAIFRAELFARAKSCMFTCKDFLTSLSFPLNPKTSPLRGSSLDQWRCFCASDCGQQGLWTTGLSWPRQNVCLEKTCCPCSFTNAESRWPLKPVPGKTGRNHWCWLCGWRPVTFLSSFRQSVDEQSQGPRHCKSQAGILNSGP